MEDPSLNGVDQTHIHIEVVKNEGIQVDYSNASNYDQQDCHDHDHDDQYSQSQPPNTAENGPQDQQPQTQPPEIVPHPSPAQPPAPPQPVQYSPQANYQTRPTGHVHQFPPQSPQPQVNFLFQNGSDNPGPFPPQSPKSQPFQAQMTQPIQMPPAQYFQQPPPPQYNQTNPMFQNGAHKPQAYLQMRSVHPPPAHSNMGPPAGASPQPAYQTAPSPVKFPPGNGGAGDFGAMPGSYPNGPTVQPNGTAQGIPMQNQYQGQPVMMVQVQQQVGTGAWNTGLFDCMDDPMNGDTLFLYKIVIYYLLSISLKSNII